MAGYGFLMMLPLVLGHLRPESEAMSSFAEGVARRDNDLEARPHFRRAAELYAVLREQQHVLNPDLCVNEGNSWLLAGDLPRAILAYRRGVELDPDRADLRHALDYARDRVDYAPEDRPRLTPPPVAFARLKSALRSWGLVVLAVCSAIGWVTLTRWRMTRERSTLTFAAVMLLFAVALAAGRGYEAAQRRRAAAEPAAATLRPVVLRKGDGPSFAPRRENPLPAGVELTVRRHRGAWSQVQLADSTLGWLPADAIAPLGTPASHITASP
ncbi:MAG: hypothetical protein ACJ8F7_16680 [Gemmataceae bacterium]